MRIVERPDSQDHTKEALLLARQIAKDEIESIERLHKRTIAQLAIIAGSVTVLWAVIAYIGFDNLKSGAIAVAESKMRDEVTRQVQEKLTKENINQIVQDQIQSYTAQSLSAQIHREISGPPLSNEIRQAASDEARLLIRKQYSQRELTREQSKALIDKIATIKELAGYPVCVNPAAFNPEAIGYASSIEASLRRSALKIVDEVGFDKPPIEGIGIYYQQGTSESIALLMQEALRAAGISSKLVPGNMQFSTQPVPPGQSPIEIFVGMRHTQ